MRAARNPALRARTDLRGRADRAAASNYASNRIIRKMSGAWSQKTLDMTRIRSGSAPAPCGRPFSASRRSSSPGSSARCRASMRVCSSSRTGADFRPEVETISRRASSHLPVAAQRHRPRPGIAGYPAHRARASAPRRLSQRGRKSAAALRPCAPDHQSVDRRIAQRLHLHGRIDCLPAARMLRNAGS